MNPDELLDELMALTRQNFSKLTDAERAALAPRIAHKTNQLVDWIGSGHPLPASLRRAQRLAPAAQERWPWKQRLIFDRPAEGRCASPECGAPLKDGLITHTRQCTEVP